MTAANVGYLSLAFLPGVRGEELTSGAYLFFLMIVMQLSLWVPVRVCDRQARALLGIRAIKCAPGPAMGGWDIAALLVTFGGGAALAVTIFVTTPFRTYAVSWLGFLALGGAVTSVILTGILRRPVIAEDEASLAVDAAVRLQDFLMAMPAVYAVPVLFDPVIDKRAAAGVHPVADWVRGPRGCDAGRRRLRELAAEPGDPGHGGVTVVPGGTEHPADLRSDIRPG